MGDELHRCHQQAALALLNCKSRLSRKEGGFLGQIAVDPSPLSEKQIAWLKRLLEKAELPRTDREELR